MTALSREGSSLCARFLFPPEFIGYQGHFPQKKVLPGVCQVQLALSALEKELRLPLTLKEVVLAKYFSPVFPDEEVTCVISGIGDCSGEFVVKAALSKNETRVAELKLRMIAEREGKG